MKQALRILIVVFWGLIFSNYFIENFEDEGLLALDFRFAFLIIALVLLIFIIFFDFLQFYKTKKWHSFLSILIAAFFILRYFILVYNIKESDKSPVILRIQQYNEKRELFRDKTVIEFRENNSYKILVSGFFEKNCIRGKYIFNNNSILIKGLLKDPLVSNRLLIKDTFELKYVYQLDIPDSSDFSDEFVIGNDCMWYEKHYIKCAYQIDELGQIIPGVAFFKVNTINEH